MKSMTSWLKEHKKWSALSLACLLCAGGALAYYIATGSGTATGKASSATPAVTFSGSAVEEVGPGESSAVSLTATNPAGGAVHIGRISGTVTVDATHEAAGCEATWFSFEGPEEALIEPGTHAIKDGTLTFENHELDQGACKGAALTIHLTS